MDISKEEIYEAIAATKSGKAPGPDGLISKFFKIFKDQMTPYIGILMNDILKSQEMLQTWREVAIMLIPKEGLDNTEIKNYRLISLLNSDYKFFAGTLATRLKKNI